LKYRKVEDEENNFEEENDENEKKAACPWGASNDLNLLFFSEKPINPSTHQPIKSFFLGVVKAKSPKIPKTKKPEIQT
jgi:hypothetical protein